MEHLSNAISKVNGPYTLVAFLVLLLLAALVQLTKNGKNYTNEKQVILVRYGLKLLFVTVVVAIVAMFVGIQGNFTIENKGEMSNISPDTSTNYTNGSSAAVAPSPSSKLQSNITVTNSGKMTNSSEHKRVLTNDK